MAKLINIEYTKTYATVANAEKAVAKLLGAEHKEESSALRYMILPVEVEGRVRYGVLFIGMSAAEEGIHFHFNCVN